MCHWVSKGWTIKIHFDQHNNCTFGSFTPACNSCFTFFCFIYFNICQCGRYKAICQCYLSLHFYDYQCIKAYFNIFINCLDLLLLKCIFISFVCFLVSCLSFFVKLPFWIYSLLPYPHHISTANLNSNPHIESLPICYRY